MADRVVIKADESAPISPKPRAAAPARTQVKMFTVELNTQGEGAIPMGWKPFQVRALEAASGVATVLIWAYR